MKSKEIKDSDCFPLLSDFINTINQLNTETGLHLLVKNETTMYFGFVGFGIGDTLALQWLGGFLEGVGKAFKFCRTCHITHDDRSDNLNNTFVLRDMKTHLIQLELLNESPDLSKQFGVKNKSVLCKLTDFDICTSLLHDPMHVLVEGVCISELKYLLNYATKEKKIDLCKINKRILGYEYFFIDKDDKPNAIGENHIVNGSFPLSAGQMITLVLNLPFILGDLFNTFDEHWLNFINLNQILNLVFSFFYDTTTLYDLNYTIRDYLEKFHSLYPSASITPKMHYLTHLTAQMENFGPLRQHACFRCEAKNGLLKSLDFKNFKNICFSAAEKHQFWMASVEMKQVNKNSLKYTDDICKVDNKRVVSDKHFYFDDLKPKSFLSVSKYLKKNGFQYTPGSFLILNFNLKVNRSESIGMIKEILVVDGIYIFYVQLHSIKKFHKNLNCFEISSEENYIYVKFDDLYFKQVQFGKYFSDLLFLQVRYLHHLLSSE